MNSLGEGNGPQQAAYSLIQKNGETPSCMKEKNLMSYQLYPEAHNRPYELPGWPVMAFGMIRRRKAHIELERRIRVSRALVEGHRGGFSPNPNRLTSVLYENGRCWYSPIGSSLSCADCIESLG
jgi:hypothetical protein